MEEVGVGRYTGGGSGSDQGSPAPRSSGALVIHEGLLLLLLLLLKLQSSTVLLRGAELSLQLRCPRSHQLGLLWGQLRRQPGQLLELQLLLQLLLLLRLLLMLVLLLGDGLRRRDVLSYGG